MFLFNVFVSVICVFVSVTNGSSSAGIEYAGGKYDGELSGTSQTTAYSANLWNYDYSHTFHSATTCKRSDGVSFTCSAKEKCGPACWSTATPLSSSVTNKCGGSSQTPINLEQSTVDSSLSEPKFTATDGGCTKWVSFGDDHAFEVAFDEPSYNCENLEVNYEGVDYTLKQFHFHSPGEHAISHGLGAAELHMVHASNSGAYLVVAVIMQSNGISGGGNQFLKRFWDVVHDGDAELSEALEGSNMKPPCGPTAKITTLSAASSGTSVSVGDARGIGVGDYIYVVDGSAAAASTYVSAIGCEVVPTGTWSLGSKSITVSSATSIAVGSLVMGAGIPLGTLVTAIAGAVVTIDLATTAKGVNASLKFTQSGVCSLTLSAAATIASGKTVAFSGSNGASVLMGSLTTAVASAATTITITEFTTGTLGLAVGQSVYSDTGFIPRGTTISSIAGFTVTLSNAVTGAIAAGSELYFTSSKYGQGSSASPSALAASGVAEISFANSDIVNINIGDAAVHSSIPTGTTVVGKSTSGKITLSAAITAAIATTSSIFFTPLGPLLKEKCDPANAIAAKESYLTAITGQSFSDYCKNSLLWEAKDQAVLNPYTSFLPSDRTFYTYSGSLTTFPCSESVRFLVYEQPMLVSNEDIKKIVAASACEPHTITMFQTIKSTVSEFADNRPLQPIGSRVVLKYEHTSSKSPTIQTTSQPTADAMKGPVGSLGIAAIIIGSVGVIAAVFVFAYYYPHHSKPSAAIAGAKQNPADADLSIVPAQP